MVIELRNLVYEEILRVLGLIILEAEKGRPNPNV